MSYTKDLELSPKFAKFLSQQGFLVPLVNAFEEYRKNQNFPFEAKDKRVFRAAILKALCMRNDLTLQEVELTADKWTDEMYELYPNDKQSEEMQELFKKYKVPKELEANVIFMAKTIDKKSFEEWIKKAVGSFSEIKAAESDDPKESKNAIENKKNKELSEKLNKIAKEENGKLKTNTKKSTTKVPKNKTK